MPVRRIVLLTLAVLAGTHSAALAQGAFPAPLPNAANSAPASSSPFPPVNGSGAVVGAPQASFPAAGASPVLGGGGMAPPPPQPSGGQQACMQEFMPLRAEVEKRGELVKQAGKRHASPVEACKLIGAYAAAELKVMKYVDSHIQQCGIPPEVPKQMRAGRVNTERMLKQVCEVAEGKAQGGGGPAAPPSLSEVIGSASVPEIKATKNGGSTFDTLSGNVLAR